MDRRPPTAALEKPGPRRLYIAVGPRLSGKTTMLQRLGALHIQALPTCLGPGSPPDAVPVGKETTRLRQVQLGMVQQQQLQHVHAIITRADPDLTSWTSLVYLANTVDLPLETTAAVFYDHLAKAAGRPVPADISVDLSAADGDAQRSLVDLEDALSRGVAKVSWETAAGPEEAAKAVGLGDRYGYKLTLLVLNESFEGLVQRNIERFVATGVWVPIQALWRSKKRMDRAVQRGLDLESIRGGGGPFS